MKIFKILTFADQLTLANALVGFLAIMYVLDGAYRVGVALILIAILIDGLDGRVARMLGKRHEFGRYLDSIADSVSFCFAPALLLYELFYELERGSAFFDPQNFLTVLTCFLIVCFGLIRLAKFSYTKEDQLSYFSGLPTPALALFIAVLYALLDTQYPLILLAVCVASILMILSLRYPKLKGYSGGIGLLAVLLAIASLWLWYLALPVLCLILLYFTAPLLTKK